MRRMSFQRVANSIVTRILLLGVAVVLLGAGARYYLLSKYLREDLGKTVETQQVFLAQYVAADIDSKLAARSTMLKQMAATFPVALLERPGDVRRWLGERFVLQPLFTGGLFITDANGLALADYPERPERVGVSYADRDYIQDALSGTHGFGRPLATGRVAREPILPLATPIKDASGKVRAVLVGITNLSTPGFLTLPGLNSLGEGGGFLVISPRDRLFVASSKPEMVMRPTPAGGVNELHDRAMAGYRGAGFTRNAQGAEEIAGIASIPATGWFVVARIPTELALASVLRAQQYVAKNSVILIIFVLVFVGVGLFAIFRPLLRTADLADRMTRGEVPLEPLPTQRNDEVGHLTQAFNRLILKLKAQHTALEQVAHHDALTGLPNRILLTDRLAHALARAHRNGSRLAVLYLDLDGFKPINDRLGHTAGDKALKELAARLASTVRESDTLARMGGDEFMVVMADLDSDLECAHAAVKTVAEKCLESLRTPMVIAGESCQLSASIGVAVGSGTSTADALHRAADMAMYQAKRGGGQRWALAPDGAVVTQA